MAGKQRPPATKAVFSVDKDFLKDFSNSPPVVPTLVCRLNPTSMQVSGGSEWRSEAGAQDRAPTPAQFVKTKPRSMSMQLLVDQFVESVDVSKEVKALQDWSVKRDARNSDAVSAPYLRFQWGSQTHFRCYLSSYQITYTMFSMTGTPLRATVSVTLDEIVEPTQGTNPTSGGTGGQREHELVIGETLHSVANDFFGRPRLWRGLAAFNGIDDPLRVGPGTVIAVPERADVEALS